MYNAQLCNLSMIQTEGESSAKCPILILKFDTGKTNKGKTLLGRVMRNKDAETCPIGALAMYFFARFNMSSETLDFSTNSAWFDINLLVNRGKNTDKRKKIPISSFTNSIADACKELRVDTAKYLHFGRSVGSKYAEKVELDASQIKTLGNWSVDCHEDRYSTKIPLKQLRAMAGFRQEKGGYILPRAEIEPCKELQKGIFGNFDQCLIEKLAVPVNHSSRQPTAIAFMEMLVELRIILLQDIAVLKRQGFEHIMLSKAAPFNTPEFDTFCTQLYAHIDNCPSGPDTSLKSIVPEIVELLKVQQHETTKNFHLLKQSIEETAKQTQVEVSKINEFIHYLNDYRRPGQSELPSTSQSADVPQASVVSNSPCYTPQIHKSIQGVWNEWKGIAEFEAVVPTPGGMEYLHNFKPTWKQSLNSGDLKRLSRSKRVVTAMNAIMEKDSLNSCPTEKLNAAINSLQVALDQNRGSMYGKFESVISEHIKSVPAKKKRKV